MTTIANFTPDALDWVHGGERGVLKPNDLLKCNTSRGNYILNKLGPRGLVTMEFGDDEEAKRRAAMKTYRDFWIKQITNFNRTNERNRNESKAYIFPSEQIEEKAAELGIDVIGPWKVNPPANDKEVARLQEENRDLKGEVGELKANVSDLTGQVQALIDALTQPQDSGDKKKGKK